MSDNNSFDQAGAKSPQKENAKKQPEETQTMPTRSDKVFDGSFSKEGASVIIPEDMPGKDLDVQTTSPGQLQDVTMDNSYAIGYRSPCISLQQYQGSTSPGQGRSVREFEEQMATLRKENFNLKLRLYFIEESIPGYTHQNTADGQDTLMKQLVDSKVEMEILRKEIQEKQEILKDAAQAMNQMEKIQKETEMKSQAIVDELNQKIQFMEMEKEMEKSQNGQLMNDLLGRSDISGNFNAIQRVRELEGNVKQSEERINDFQEQIQKLDGILSQRDETIKEYEDKVKELAFQNAELVESLENAEKEVATAESQRLREELQDHKRQLADKICMLEEAEDKIKNRSQAQEQACKAIQKLMLKIKNLQDEKDKLKKDASLSNTKENSDGSAGVSGLEFTGLCRSLSDTEALSESNGQQHKLEGVIQQQEATIQKLKSEVKKNTANLQNIVNKELWEKNREIERLTTLLNKAALSPLSPLKDNTATFTVDDQLKQSFTDSEYTQALELNKVLQKKVDILIQRLATPADRSSEAIIQKLCSELREARDDTERAEKWRRECADVCTSLTVRLEELAGFLDSLLKHKDVLGALAIDRRRAMRKAVDRSLDFSKSLNMTLSISNLSMMDHSIANFSNFSGILDVTTASMGNRENKTFNSHEEQYAGHSVETLQAELRALKKELEMRRSTEAATSAKKDRRSLPIAFENQSESEAWSEPDRKVSMARIGLEGAAKHHSASIAAGVASSIEEHSTDSDSNALNHNRSSKSRTLDRIAQLEAMISEKDNRILEVQCELVDADNRLKKENLRVIDMNREVEELRMRNQELLGDLQAIAGNNNTSGGGVLNQSTLLRQIDEKTRSIEKIQDERDRITVQARVAEIQIVNLKTEIDDLKLKHKEASSMAEEQEKQKLDCLHRDLKELMDRRLREQEKEHQDTLAREWIARTLYEENARQLQLLQKKLSEANNTIEYLTENESELRQSLVDNELEMRAIRKNLDETTLQASKAVLERTKALNEKLQLETRLQELGKQIQTLELEKSNFVQTITHLEQSHTILQEQLSATTATSKQNVAGSDVSQSGYTSEEVPLCGVGRNIHATVESLRLNNSSPDLGIESDAGRVSNVEISNAQRSLLKTVELSPKGVKVLKEAISNVDGTVNTTTNSNTTTTTNLQLEDATKSAAPPSVTHDCAKVEQENAELRRKLIRTKRAFEDTYNKLRISNQKKEQVEKDIKNQILKTHNVLKNVRSNMENEL